MTNSYLLEVIKVMQTSERQKITQFLASPVFNQGSNAVDLMKLYQLILNAAPDFSEPLLRKDHVYFQLFPDPAMVPGKLEKLMAGLNKLIRTYILTTRYLSDDKEQERQIHWCAWLREQGLAERSRQVLAKIESENKQVKQESLNGHRFNWLLAEENHAIQNTFNRAKGDLHIPQLLDRLGLFYHNYRLDILNRYQLQNKATPLPEIDLEEQGVDFYQKDSRMLQVARQVLHLLTEPIPSEEGTSDFLRDLSAYSDGFSYDTQADFYAYLRNFLTILINHGKLHYMPVLYELQKDGLERGFFDTFNGQIPLTAYVNLSMVALQAGKHEWSRRFIEEFKGKILGGDEQGWCYQFLLAQHYFSCRQFNEARDALPDAPFPFTYHHMLRRLEIKIYYELKSDLLLFKIDAFRKYNERTALKSISANIRTMNRNFANILLQMCQLPVKDKLRAARLLKQIESKKLIAERFWLVEKVKELM